MRPTGTKREGLLKKMVLLFAFWHSLYTALAYLAWPMKYTWLIMLGMALAATTQAQYRYDDSLFTPVMPAHLCDTLQAHPNRLILDVRNPDEFAENAKEPGYNMGRLKEAKNLRVEELFSRLKEVQAYKDQPIFVVCTHAQRSRRAAKILADNGFSQVYNINGGMAEVQEAAATNPCLQAMVTSTLPYTVVAPANACQLLQNPAGRPLVLDVRPDSAWLAISKNAKHNAMGRFARSLHISLAHLEKRMKELPDTGRLFITDMDGNDAAKAGSLLAARGRKNLYVMLEGFNAWQQTPAASLPCLATNYVANAPFKTLSPPELGQWLEQWPQTVMIDLRDSLSFHNQHPEAARNQGHIANALNIPYDSLEAELPALLPFKNEPVVLYSSTDSPEVYTAAQMLAAKGFTQVRLLAGGLKQLRWYPANKEGFSWLEDLVVNVPEANK